MLHSLLGLILTCRVSKFAAKHDSNNNLISISSGTNSITYEYDNYQNPFKFDELLNLSHVQNFINVLQNNFFSSNRSNNVFNNTNNITSHLTVNNIKVASYL